MEREESVAQSAVPTAMPIDILNKLELADIEMSALKEQGFVSYERREGRLGIFKLRFRVKGKQVVRSLGSSSAFGASVAIAVQRLQQPKRTQREIQKLNKESRRYLKMTKRLLVPVL